MSLSVDDLSGATGADGEEGRGAGEGAEGVCEHVQRGGGGGRGGGSQPVEQEPRLPVYSTMQEYVVPTKSMFSVL